MHKVKVIVVLVVAVFALALSAAAQEQTPEAPRLSVDFPVLTAGESVDGLFEDTTMQLYAFIGTQGDLVTITMVQPDDSALDPFLMLLGPNGEVLAYNDDNASGSLTQYAAEIVDVELPVTGAYLIAASSYFEIRESSIAPGETLDEPQAYTLTADGFTTPADETDVARANGIIVTPAEDGTSEASGTMTLSLERPVGYLIFPATEGQTITLATSQADADPALNDTMVYVFDAQGRRVISVDDTENGTFAEVQVSAPNDGTYIVFLTAYGFWAANDDPENYPGVGTANVTFSLQAAP